MKKLTVQDYNHIRTVKSLLTEKYGGLIHKIICFGSRVSRQVRDTDFDVLIVTSSKVDWRKEDEISEVFYLYGLEHDILFHCIFYSREEYEVKYSYIPLITEVNATGLVI